MVGFEYVSKRNESFVDGWGNSSVKEGSIRVCICRVIGMWVRCVIGVADDSKIKLGRVSEIVGQIVLEARTVRA